MPEYRSALVNTVRLRGLRGKEKRMVEGTRLITAFSPVKRKPSIVWVGLNVVREQFGVPSAQCRVQHYNVSERRLMGEEAVSPGPG